MRDPQVVIAKQIRYQLRKQAKAAWNSGRKKEARELLIKARLTEPVVLAASATV